MHGPFSRGELQFPIPIMIYDGAISIYFILGAIAILWCSEVEIELPHDCIVRHIFYHRISIRHSDLRTTEKLKTNDNSFVSNNDCGKKIPKRSSVSTTLSILHYISLAKSEIWNCHAIAYRLYPIGVWSSAHSSQTEIILTLAKAKISTEFHPFS